jgi:hypothetical protein
MGERPHRTSSAGSVEQVKTTLIAETTPNNVKKRVSITLAAKESHNKK